MPEFNEDYTPHLHPEEIHKLNKQPHEILMSTWCPYHMTPIMLDGVNFLAKIGGYHLYEPTNDRQRPGYFRYQYKRALTVEEAIDYARFHATGYSDLPDLELTLSGVAEQKAPEDG